MSRLRQLLLGGPVSVLLIGLMLLGCLLMWIGVPVGWLWIGSQLQASTEVGTALMVTMVGALGSIIAIAPVLVWLNRRHIELREARGLPVGENSPLEVMLVVSAAIAIVGFTVWFLAFSGSSPIPLNIGY
jgi:heme/copper-type cytochrome/quinol oxidase subunit 2